MKIKSKFCLLAVCLLVTFLSVTTNVWADSDFKVFWGKKELKQTSGKPVIFNNRLLIPVNLLTQANFSVDLQGKSLFLSDNRTKYINNLYLLDKYRKEFSDKVNELDKESLSLLGDIVLERNADDTKLMDLIDELQKSAKISYEYINELTIIGDRPDGFLGSLTCVDNYRLAVDHLLSYKTSRASDELEDFYQYRLKALEAFDTISNEYNQYYNMSLEKSLH
ncbi:hypothetical protein [Paenibacillus tengchongensis]|uniref:hypothetical protein n=1 Tax=Paenibacillus tengchongensis TaxID=2608684 RepID=UPI00124D5E4B|nr:hypothetical protein [Paenibacillus tengchongensis]